MLLAAIVAASASWALRRRVVSDDARAAAFALRVFWAGLGGTALVQTGMLVLADVGVEPSVALAILLLSYGTSVVALGALAAYFVFMFTGSRWAVPVTVALYVVVLVLGSWNHAQSNPVDIRLTRWGFEPVYANPPGGPLAAAPALAALLPAIGGSIAFVVLGLRSSGPTRQRGILVGTALALWFSTVLAIDSGAITSDAGILLSKFVSLAGIGAIFLAYLAPRALREPLGLVVLGEEHEHRDHQATRKPAKRRLSDGMRARVRELI